MFKKDISPNAGPMMDVAEHLIFSDVRSGYFSLFPSFSFDFSIRLIVYLRNLLGVKPPDEKSEEGEEG